MNRSCLFSLASCCLLGLFACQSTGNKSHDPQPATIAAADSPAVLPISDTADTITYKQIPDEVVAMLNKQVAAQKLFQTDDIMQAYAPESKETEGNYHYHVATKVLDAETKAIILTEEGIMDDAIAGKKVVMVIKQNGETVQVISIKEAYKCWPGRGHEDWSDSPCK